MSLTMGDARSLASESEEIRKEREMNVTYTGEGNGDDLSVIDFAGDPERAP